MENLEIYLDYIGEDSYVYRYDYTSKRYYNTGISLKGSPGNPGRPGKDGKTPHIGTNGNWFIGEKDTGVKASGDTGPYKIGILGNAQETEYYTQEEADAYNLENGLSEGDPGFVTTETVKNPAVLHTVKSYVDKQIENLIGAAPEELDTLKEISDILSSAYQKPAGGIPKTDLAQGVKDSLDLADTALQEDTLYEDANGHDYVEIAGMKWATKNIGANAITDAGLYFQWGDTQGVPADDDSKESDNPWQTYKFAVFDGEEYVMGKYNSIDDLTKLELSDDAARESWGGSWRMPTADDFQNFLEAVNVVWVNDYQSSGVAGLVCTDKTDNSKVVFFPAAGFHNGMEVVANNNGYYWSDTRADNDYYAAKFEFNNSRTRINDGVRCDIISIRPILDTTQLKQDLDKKQNTLVSGTNIKTINNESILGSGNINIVTELPSNLAYTSNDNGEGIIPSDGIRAVTVTSAATMTINPDVVTIIDGAVGTAAITLQVPQDNLAHVWDILMTTDSTVAITFAMSNSATILYPNGFSVGASKAVEISVIGVGTKYYLRYGEFA